MFTLKIFGMLLVLSVGCFAAYSAVCYERRRLIVLDGWIDLIFYIRSQIDCYLTPLDEILESGDVQMLRACMPASQKTDLGAVLHAGSIYLDGETNHLLESFVREIGGCYREEQVRRCDYYVAELRTHRKKLADELPARIRLCVALCLCIAIAVAILLW